ncbi:MAG: hypothetical protein QW176_02315 [Candidatus Bathyarchaeia archaeon]
MRTRTTLIIAVPLILLLLSMRVWAFQPIEAETDPGIMARIDRSMGWLQAHRTVTALVSYYSSSPEGSIVIDVAENSAVAYTLTMHTKLIPTREDVPEILEILKFILNGKAGAYFHPYYDPNGGGWISRPQPYYRNAEIIQNLAFTSFHLRLEDQILTDEERSLLDRVVGSSKNLIGEMAETYRGSDGSWTLRYENGDLQTRLGENSMILVSLLHIAAYEEEWGSPEGSNRYGGYAQETARWILENQERDPAHWGYGGFYDTVEASSQSTLSNAVAVFSLTTYLRLISLIDEEPNPTIQEVREAIILWEEGFLKRIVDEHGGPCWGRDETGMREYPKELLAASLTLRAMAETWVVHGDPKYRLWCATLYEWITGKNEAGLDLQLGDGSCLNGFPNPMAPGDAADLYVNAYTTASLIYGAWINIPEIPQRAIEPLLTLTLMLFTLLSVSGFRLVSRLCPGRVQIDRRALKPQSMNPSSPYESYTGNL